MSPIPALLAALSIACAACAALPALAQNAPITNPPNVITPPAALPDLLLPSPQITAVCNANKTVTITIKATFKNIGQAPAKFTASQTVAKSSYGFGSGAVNLVDPGSKPVATFVTGPATIAPGASHAVLLTIGPMSRYKPLPTPGMYLAGAAINPNKSIAETNPHNNGSGRHVEDPCFGK